MIVAGIFLNLICGCVLTSGVLYGANTFGGEEWWTKSFFLKFYTPSGKNYFIDSITGEICKNEGLIRVINSCWSRIYVSALERLGSAEESAKDVTSPASPYISFISLHLKVYDIYFEQEDLNYIPHIGEY